MIGLRKSVASLVSLVGALAVGSARAQSSDAQTCAGPVVRASAELEHSWAAALGELRAKLTVQSDIDRCAQVGLRDNGERVLVTVLLGDGRLAARTVSTADAAVASVEALLTVLPGLELSDAPKLPEESKELPVAKVVAEAKPEASTPETSAESARSKPARVIEVDLGFGATARVSGRPWFLGYGLEAHAGVAINGWLIGGWARWIVRDQLLEGKPPPQLIVSSFLLGAFAGRRLVLRSVALDLLIGPNLVLNTEEAAGDPTDIGGEIGSFALSTTLRLLVPRHGSPGFFSALVADLTPARITHPQHTDPALPDLPPWGASIVLGVFWGGL